MKKDDIKTIGVLTIILFVAMFAIGSHFGIIQSILPNIYAEECAYPPGGDPYCDMVKLVSITGKGPFVAGEPFEIDITLKNTGNQMVYLYIEGGMVPESWGGYSILFDENAMSRYNPFSSAYSITGISQENIMISEQYVMISDVSCCPGNEFYHGMRVQIPAGSTQSYTLRPTAPSEGSQDSCNNQGPAFVGYSDGSWSKSYVVGVNIMKWVHDGTSSGHYDPTASCYPSTDRVSITYWWMGGRTLHEPEIICHSNNDCSSPTASRCVNAGTTNSFCRACSSDSHCNHITGRPKCDDGVCVPITEQKECDTHADCTSEFKSRCLYGECVKCEINAHCEHISGKPICDNGVCVALKECFTNVDCTEATKSQCKNNECVSCEANTHCNHIEGKPICYEGDCVECVANMDCPYISASLCKDNTCSACETNADCNHIDGRPFCVDGVCSTSEHEKDEVPEEEKDRFVPKPDDGTFIPRDPQTGEVQTWFYFVVIIAIISGGLWFANKEGWI